MQVKRINTEKLDDTQSHTRPSHFDDFIWQEEIKKILKTAIKSSEKREKALGHILLSGESWFGKTTLAQIVAKTMGVNIKIITWYAITKPAELISILNSLEDWDIVFIDEIHRIKPNIEEILYIAMEDFVIDMVMPEWWNVRIPVNNFCLVWATTKLESLSIPLKNRFVYKFHFVDYNENEKIKIIQRYLRHYGIKFDPQILNDISRNLVSVPREINNFCVKLRDYLISQWVEEKDMEIEKASWERFKIWAQLSQWWLTSIHKRYIEILEQLWWGPIWLKTIALKLWINEKSVEEDIESLLLKLWKIDKTTRWRILK